MLLFPLWHRWSIPQTAAAQTLSSGRRDGAGLLRRAAADADTLLHSSYYETSAAVMGLYVQAADDFSAQLVYTDPNGDYAEPKH